MSTLAIRHRQRMLAAAAAIAASAGAGPVRSGPAATEYELLRAQLGNDLRRLSEIQSTEGKVALKHDLEPTYRDWVAGVLDADSGAADDILTWMMIWRIDIGAFDAALPLAAYVIRHNLTLPDRFDRTAPTLICEEIAEAALKRLGQGPEHMPPAEERAGLERMLDTLLDVETLVIGQDIFDQVRAKLEKAQGLALIRMVEVMPTDADGPAGAHRAARDRAVRHLRRALELDASSGVKKRLEQVERAIRQSETPS